jgi:hypothetical protein
MHKLRIENLEVESFATAAQPSRRGTVRGHGEDCTWVDTCLCPTAYHQCGTGMQTIHSCDYTNNELCELTADCERTAVDCRDTSYAQCGTRADTPVC